MCNTFSKKLISTGNYQSIYDNSYDYTIYDIGFIFNVDDEVEQEVSPNHIEQDHINIDFPGTGGNVH